MGTNGKPQQSNHPVLDIALMPHKYVIFEQKVWCIGQMNTLDFDRFIESYMTHAKLVEILLTEIDRKRWDKWERWFLLNELVTLKKLKIYDSHEQAEQAMRSVA